MEIGLLGGGITSLALGYFLKKPYEILEKNERLGGLCRTIIDQGYTFDPHGAHILFSKNKKILALEKKLLGQNLRTRFRSSRIFFKDRLIKYPFENDLGSLDKQDTFDCLIGYINNSSAKPTNLNEWFYYTFGKGISEKYLLPYNKKIWKTDPKRMGMEWVERIPKPPVEDVVKSALGIPTEGYIHQLNFLYPQEGGVEALIHAFEKANKGIITKNFLIDGIYFEKNKWIITAGKEKRSYDHIVSTICLFDLFKLLKNIRIPIPVQQAINNLEYRKLITVMLGLNTPRLTNLVAIYFPDPDFLPHRITFPPNFSPKTVPAGHFSLMAEITDPSSGEGMLIDYEKIYQNVIAGLIKRNIIHHNSVVYKNIALTKYAYPVYNLDYTKSMKIIRAYLQEIGIHICGRFGGFEYINTDVCIENAEKLAYTINALQ